MCSLYRHRVESSRQVNLVILRRSCVKTWHLIFSAPVRYDYDMAKIPKRSGLYSDEMGYSSPYPDQQELIRKRCDVCGAEIVVNNWPDQKSRTPKIFDLVVCISCDPRHPEDHYTKVGYRILHRDRLRVIRLAQVTRAMSKHGCIKLIQDDDDGHWYPALDCKCAGCAARKLFPGVN